MALTLGKRLSLQENDKKVRALVAESLVAKQMMKTVMKLLILANYQLDPLTFLIDVGECCKWMGNKKSRDQDLTKPPDWLYTAVGS